MVSKALFKQSCKANGMMWIIITAATCFMLACVMLISGNGNITATKDAIEDTIIINEIDSAAETRAINYYSIETDGLGAFDGYFQSNAGEVIPYYMQDLAWYAEMPARSNYSSDEEHFAAAVTWKGSMPKAETDSTAMYASYITDWLEEMPDPADYGSAAAATAVASTASRTFTAGGNSGAFGAGSLCSACTGSIMITGTECGTGTDNSVVVTAGAESSSSAADTAARTATTAGTAGTASAATAASTATAANTARAATAAITATTASSSAYSTAVLKWKLSCPLISADNQEHMVRSAFTVAAGQLQDYIYARAAAIDPAYTPESDEAQEMLGCVMYALNPEGAFDDFYAANGEVPPEDYDVTGIITALLNQDTGYIQSEERAEYIADRSEYCASVFLAGNLVMDENIDKIVDQLEAYGVTRDKYDSFGYTYDTLYDSARTTIISYRYRYAYEKGLIDDMLADGTISQDEYAAKLAEMNSSISQEISGSLLTKLPAEVSEALEELGQMDLYSLIVGSIFYKLAGLLLPIIYMIMASNNLISGQVDSGSMAYVLSSSTKRKSVVVTQALYLIGSIFLMFCCTTITGCICLACIDVAMTYGQLLLLNLGAFLVLFTLSGLCFATSCWFDRSKRSMAIGGGLSIFALVAAMLGLFGSPVIPSIIRLKSLNYFNYVTVISLFDVVSIIDMTTAFIWKMAILLVLGIIGYIAGSIRFCKKDLPL